MDILMVYYCPLKKLVVISNSNISYLLHFDISNKRLRLIESVENVAAFLIERHRVSNKKHGWYEVIRENSYRRTYLKELIAELIHFDYIISKSDSANGLYRAENEVSILLVDFNNVKKTIKFRDGFVQYLIGEGFVTENDRVFKLNSTHLTVSLRNFISKNNLDSCESINSLFIYKCDNPDVKILLKGFKSQKVKKHNIIVSDFQFADYTTPFCDRKVSVLLKYLESTGAVFLKNDLVIRHITGSIVKGGKKFDTSGLKKSDPLKHFIDEFILKNSSANERTTHSRYYADELSNYIKDVYR